MLFKQLKHQITWLCEEREIGKYNHGILWVQLRLIFFSSTAYHVAD